MGRHILEPAKRGVSIAAGHFAEFDLAGARISGRTGFVEPDVTIAANAEDLEIDPTYTPDFPLVSGAVGNDFRVGKLA